jgi:hypothetical protein
MIRPFQGSAPAATPNMGRHAAALRVSHPDSVVATGAVQLTHGRRLLSRTGSASLLPRPQPFARHKAVSQGDDRP